MTTVRWDSEFFTIEDQDGNITRIPLAESEEVNISAMIAEHGKALRGEETSREVEVIVRAGE